MEEGGLDGSKPSPGSAPDAGPTRPVKPGGLPLPNLRHYGHQVIAPTYTRTFFAVLSGATTVQQVAAIVGLSETTTSSHLKRLRGLGLIDWTYTARNQRGVRILRSCVESVPFNNERGEDTIAIVLASEDGQEFSDVAPLVRPVEPTITNVRELRKGDVLTLEGQDYPVKEVRIGQKAKRAAIRLGIPDGEWWYKPPLDQPITAVRTHEAQRRISQATEARDGMYRYGR